MRKIICIVQGWKKLFLHWEVQLFFVLLACITGLIGYYMFYRNVIQAAYSTIRLFVFCFDINWDEFKSMDFLPFCLLQISRWMAVFFSGTALFKVFAPLCEKILDEHSFRKWKCQPKKLLLIGNNKENDMILCSLENTGNGLIINEASSDMSFRILKNKKLKSIKVTGYDITEEITCFVKDAIIHKKLEHIIIINTQDEGRNLQFTHMIVDILGQYIDHDWNEYRNLVYCLAEKEAKYTQAQKDTIRQKILSIEKRIVCILNRLQVVVFGNAQYENVYYHMQEKTMGVLQYTNKYEVIAYDFVAKHPLTEYLSSGPNGLLRGNGCLAEDSEIRVVLVGFGDVNRHIYTTSIATNQFITCQEGRCPEVKQVRYYIFDRDVTSYGELILGPRRYEMEFMKAVENGTIKREDYLELPPIAAYTETYSIDIHSPEFYQQLLRILNENPNSINHVIVSIGNDMENIALAQWIAVKRHEWGLKQCYIFTRVRQGDIGDIILNEKNGTHTEHNFITFGDEPSEIFNLKAILHNNIFDMAKKRNQIYVISTAYRDFPVIQTEEDMKCHADFLWYTMENDKKLSNVYAILSIRFKLHLIGLDFIRGEAPYQALKDNTAYLAIYAANDVPVYAGTEFKGKPIVQQNGKEMFIDFAKCLVRKNMAVQEHYRWNAFMMSRGFVPNSKREMERGLGHVKDYSLRTHGNLTTQAGLIDYRNFMVGVTGEVPESVDVIHYDYQLMDDLWWILVANDLHIVKRNVN